MTTKKQESAYVRLKKLVHEISMTAELDAERPEVDMDPYFKKPKPKKSGKKVRRGRP